jgi:hypothetical protein
VPAAVQQSQELDAGRLGDVAPPALVGAVRLVQGLAQLTPRAHPLTDRAQRVWVASIKAARAPTGWPNGLTANTRGDQPVRVGSSELETLALREDHPLKRIAAAVAVVALLCTASAGAATVPEKQAIGSAKQYLALTAFSRLGLIQQLVVGSGYPKRVATYAVDSLRVNYNTQAVKSAKQYLTLTHFSCSGMIQQLEIGSQFTKAQATYGAKKTHLC